MKERKVTLATKCGYGSGDMYAGGAFLLIGLLFLNFLTDVVGLSGKLAGLVFLIGKIWDAVSDPLMGYISDRTRSRFGRRRIYFLIGIFPVFFTFGMLWYQFNGSELATFFYYAVAYILFNTVFTMVMVPYNALLPNMIKEYRLRTSFNTYRMVFSAISAIISGVLPMIIVNMFDSEGVGFMMMGIIFGVIYALPWIFVFLKTWELPVEEELPRGGNPVKEITGELKKSFRNRSFRRHSSFFVSTQTATDFLMTLFIYYLTYVLDRKPEFAAIMGVLLVTQLIMMPIHGKISRKYGKTVPLQIGAAVWVLGLLLALFINSDSPFYMVYLVAALSAVGTSASVFVPWSILPEISDVDEIITGQRREGVYAGMSTLIRKMAQAISVFLIGVYLDLVGFIPNVTQTSTAQNGIRVIFFVGPLLFLVLGFTFVRRYSMTEEKHTILMNEIVSRKEGNAPSNDSKVIETLEELTGLPHSELSTF